MKGSSQSSLEAALLESLKESLKESYGEVDWQSLQSHALRDAIVVVNPELDLMEVGVCVAADQKEKVAKWIEEKKLGKPTPHQMGDWTAKPTKKFLSLIVQPFVLIQELPEFPV